MSSGHGSDSLTEAWQREPDDLVKGFLSVPFPEVEGTRHAYDNATTYVLARIVERVTGRGLPELLRGQGHLGQHCVVVPEHDLVVVVTAAVEETDELPGVLWECPLPGLDVVAGAADDTVFVADLYVITSPHRVRLVVDPDAGTATLTWGNVPLTTPDLTLHLRAPLMTRPDVA